MACKDLTRNVRVDLPLVQSRIPLGTPTTRKAGHWSLVHCGALKPSNSLKHWSFAPLTITWPTESRVPCSTRCEAADLSAAETSDSDSDWDKEEVQSPEKGVEYVVVNFYHFAKIIDPHSEVERHREFVDGCDIRGRIYINEQGINAQLSGPRSDAVAYAEWVKADHRFADLLIQVAHSRGHAFPRLRLRYKQELVQVTGGTLGLPLVDPSARATPLSPAAWKAKLEQHKRDIRRLVASQGQMPEHNTASSSEVASNADDKAKRNNTRSILLLDVRNSYEWDVGHFKGAQRPPVDNFRSTEFGLSEGAEATEDPLVCVDKENTEVMMYCTGGIRCDVYSTVLRQRGFKNLYALEGGIANYLKQEGDAHWAGNLFVFDARLAVPPRQLSDANSFEAGSEALPVASCRVCGGPATEGRHRNCANTDCNVLFLSCHGCASVFKGCCSEQCSQAPRLRPFLAEAGQYNRLHVYREGARSNSSKPSRRSVQRRQRKERRLAEQMAKQQADSRLEIFHRQHSDEVDDVNAELKQMAGSY